MAIIDIPGSKSITNRALFLASAARGRSTLQHPLVSDDSEAFSGGLRALGYGVDTSAADAWHIIGSPDGPPVDAADVFCRDAATAARFLPALAASGHGHYRFDASDQMRRRPVGPVTDALTDLGARIKFHGPVGHLPFDLTAAGVTGGSLTVRAGLSSQFLSAVLMLGPLTDRGITITVPELVSRPYIDITIAAMRSFGVDVVGAGDTYQVAAAPYDGQGFAVEPDASTASYFFALAALLGTEITVPRLGEHSAQGDLQFIRVLEQMGATVRQDADSTTVQGTGDLHGLTVNMRDISDTMPTLAAIAPFADRPVRIVDVYNTRVKECDRLAACAENLTRMGVPVDTGRDWIEIRPALPRTATITCHGDHRIAMAFSIAGLRTPGGVALDDPGCVRKTFPGFHDVLRDVVEELGAGTGPQG